jgi:predicted RNA binding protein YcfA (HicA-like mRNA interferase family)
VKIPRDIKGKELAKLLRKFGYVPTRQTGSHLRLTTQVKGEHHITIPRHGTLKIGTLNNIMKDVAIYLEKGKEEVIRELFEKG